MSVITRSKRYGFGGGMLANVGVPCACSCQVIGRVVLRQAHRQAANILCHIPANRKIVDPSV